MHIAALFTELAVTAPAACAWLAAHWQSFASSAGALLITSIWQGAVIVSVLEVATRLMPRISATHRFALWSAGFALSLALPLLPLLKSMADVAPALAAAPSTASGSARSLFQLDARWGLAIAVLWLTASLIRAAALALHSIRLRRLWKAAEPAVSAPLSTSLDHLRGKRVDICSTQMLDRPSVIGFLSPRILIPDWLFPRLTPGELDQIVLHEAEHLRRGDDWTNLIQKLCLLLFPLNPALAWIEHRLCREREMACDEGVIRITNAPRAYAACLASLAERHLERRAEALSLGAWHRRSELVHRVHRILIHKRTMSGTAASTLLAMLGFLLAAGSVEMSRLPQFVAFVPSHSPQAMTPARQVQLNALLARENAETKLHLPPSYHAVQAKAVVPDQPSITPARTHKRASIARSTGAAVDTTANAAMQIAKSDELGDRVIPSQPQPQQWVFVTTWSEVSSGSRAPHTISDFEPEHESTRASANSRALAGAATAAVNTPGTSPANTGGAQTRNQTASAAHHFTVTQLILRVVPASPNSTSTQPPTTTVRDGWFVIQL